MLLVCQRIGALHRVHTDQVTLDHKICDRITLSEAEAQRSHHAEEWCTDGRERYGHIDAGRALDLERIRRFVVVVMKPHSSQNGRLGRSPLLSRPELSASRPLALGPYSSWWQHALPRSPVLW